MEQRVILKSCGVIFFLKLSAACRIVKISLQSLFCQVIAVKTAFPVFIDRVENAVFRILVLSPDPPLNSLSVDGDGALDKPFRNLHALLGGDYRNIPLIGF